MGVLSLSLSVGMILSLMLCGHGLVAAAPAGRAALGIVG